MTKIASPRLTRRNLLHLAIGGAATATLAACGVTTDNVCFTGATLSFQRTQAQDGLSNMVGLLSADPAVAASNANLIQRANDMNAALEGSKSGGGGFDLADCAFNQNIIVQSTGYKELEDLLIEANDILEEGYIAAIDVGIVDSVTLPARRNWIETWWDYSSP